MSGMAGVDTISETEIFEQLGDLDDHVGCSYGNCDKAATHFLVCAEEGCESAETICNEHTFEFLLIKTMKIPSTITFDNTCLHSPLIMECDIRPMA